MGLYTRLVPRKVTRLVPREVTRLVPREVTRPVPREVTRPVPRRPVPREVTRPVPREVTRPGLLASRPSLPLASPSTNAVAAVLADIRLRMPTSGHGLQRCRTPCAARLSFPTTSALVPYPFLSLQIFTTLSL